MRPARFVCCCLYGHPWFECVRRRLAVSSLRVFPLPGCCLADGQCTISPDVFYRLRRRNIGVAVY